jgi:hypothetical protein
MRCGPAGPILGQDTLTRFEPEVSRCRCSWTYTTKLTG